MWSIFRRGRALTTYLTTFQPELATVVRDLQGLRSRVTDTNTVGLVIKRRSAWRSLNDSRIRTSSAPRQQELSRLSRRSAFSCSLSNDTIVGSGGVRPFLARGQASCVFRLGSGDGRDGAG